MFRGVKLILAVIASTVMCGTTVAASKRPATGVWNYYHFNGAGFEAGPSLDGRAFIALRERVHPVVLLARTRDIEPIALQEDAGVIAGICYIKSSVGKLGGGNSGYAPSVHAAILVSSGGKPFVTAQTDDNGYFAIVLPEGKYSIGSGPFATEATVERGITSLVTLKAGKRMVD
ncbi:MAG: hypothetical protein PHD54_02200 [Desulfuromonadaceae bacterium]|nr:hypothetical protein [Desulfuromonadaceae bacterium]